MSNVIYNVSSLKNDPMIGKHLTPIMMLIEKESDAVHEKLDTAKSLYNCFKSNRFSETIIGQSEFSEFSYKGEGAGADNDSVQKTFDKTIPFFAVGKNFAITQEMLDDSKFGMGQNLENAPKSFINAYKTTLAHLLVDALTKANASRINFNGANVDLTTGDNLPLFHNAHTYYTDEMKATGGTQCNYFWCNIGGSGKPASISDVLALLANKVSNFKDENGNTLGYTADTIVIPGNRTAFEHKIRAALGSEYEATTSNNGINTQYGIWNLVKLYDWQANDDRMIVMSSAANKNLMGNLFFTRRQLDIKAWQDENTRNYMFNGYARQGVGFASWKHAAMFVNKSSAPEATASELT